MSLKHTHLFVLFSSANASCMSSVVPIEASPKFSSNLSVPLFQKVDICIEIRSLVVTNPKTVLVSQSHSLARHCIKIDKLFNVCNADVRLPLEPSGELRCILTTIVNPPQSDIPSSMAVIPTTDPSPLPSYPPLPLFESKPPLNSDPVQNTPQQTVQPSVTQPTLSPASSPRAHPQPTTFETPTEPARRESSGVQSLGDDQFGSTISMEISHALRLRQRLDQLYGDKYNIQNESYPGVLSNQPLLEPKPISATPTAPSGVPTISQRVLPVGNAATHTPTDLPPSIPITLPQTSGQFSPLPSNPTLSPENLNTTTSKAVAQELSSEDYQLQLHEKFSRQPEWVDDPQGYPVTPENLPHNPTIAPVSFESPDDIEPPNLDTLLMEQIKQLDELKAVLVSRLQGSSLKHANSNFTRRTTSKAPQFSASSRRNLLNARQWNSAPSSTDAKLPSTTAFSHPPPDCHPQPLPSPFSNTPVITEPCQIFPQCTCGISANHSTLPQPNPHYQNGGVSSSYTPQNRLAEDVATKEGQTQSVVGSSDYPKSSLPPSGSTTRVRRDGSSRSQRNGNESRVPGNPSSAFAYLRDDAPSTSSARERRIPMSAPLARVPLPQSPILLDRDPTDSHPILPPQQNRFQYHPITQSLRRHHGKSYHLSTMEQQSRLRQAILEREYRESLLQQQLNELLSEIPISDAEEEIQDTRNHHRADMLYTRHSSPVSVTDRPSSSKYRPPLKARKYKYPTTSVETQCPL